MGILKGFWRGSLASQDPRQRSTSVQKKFPTHWANRMRIAGIAIAAVLVVWIAWSLFGSFDSVESYRHKVISQLNRELLDRNNAIRKRIEHAHVTVTSTGAKVSSCAIRTVDGSQRAGKRGSNIGQVDVVITVFWNGYIQKNGFTEFEVVYDAQNNKVKETKFLKSNANFNWETVNWYKVGYDAGYAIAYVLAQ